MWDRHWFLLCLDAATGALRWRFYAGGAPRQIVSHGQVESSWPVYNVVIHQGLACFTAGLHPETGGGIYAGGAAGSVLETRYCPSKGFVRDHCCRRESEVYRLTLLLLVRKRPLSDLD